VLAVDNDYLLQIPLTTMGKVAKSEIIINAQFYPILGGMEFPSNPELQTKLTIKAHASGYLNDQIQKTK